MPKRRHKVIKSAEEAQRAAISEQMLAAGKKNFEQVYGSKTPNSFNLNADINAMTEVKMMTTNEAKQNALAGAQPSPVNFTPEQKAPQPELPSAQSEEADPEQQKPEDSILKELWMTQTNGQVPFNEWLESMKTEEQLSEDPVKRIEQIAQFIGKTNPNAPTAQMLQNWKQMHGDIFMLNIADRIFIYRYLKRQEWIQINSNPKINELSESQIEEDMFNRCVLWPQMDMIQKAGMPAGGIPMVVQQIRLQSLFLDPGYVAQLTIKI